MEQMWTGYCLVCNRELTINEHAPSRGERVEDQFSWVNHAVVCEAYGNYGSTVFDPLGDAGHHLRFFVCDECLRARAAKIEHVVVRKVRPELIGRQSFTGYLAHGRMPDSTSPEQEMLDAERMGHLQCVLAVAREVCLHVSGELNAVPDVVLLPLISAVREADRQIRVFDYGDNPESFWAAIDESCIAGQLCGIYKRLDEAWTGDSERVPKNVLATLGVFWGKLATDGFTQWERPCYHRQKPEQKPEPEQPGQKR